jgi:hypothetical protein
MGQKTAMNRSVAGRHFLRILLAVLLFGAAVPAWAHYRTAGGPQSGIAIPSLSHGEMAVIAGYRGAIIDLADDAADTSEDFRRLLNYAHIQYSYCLWGAVPASVSDENSPFNECSHAYLAATKAVLLRMRAMPAEAAAAGDLISRIDAELVQRQLSFVLCQFSGEAFNTADIVRPQWSGIPFHAASLASFTVPTLLLCLAFLGLRKTKPGQQNPG